MKFRDLGRQYTALKEKIDSAVIDVMESADFIMGKKVLQLEKKLEEYIGVKYCISCGNGTDALELALMAWDIKQGDAVFVPDMTFFSTGEVVVSVGATPVFVDVDYNTYNISIDDLRNSIDKVINEGILKPKVIIAVDLFGLPANFIEIKKLAKEYNLLILEDGAQGFGGAVNTEGKWQKACSFGDISTTSFFPAKPLGCYGDGGAIFTDNEEWANLINSLKIHGKASSKYENVRIGMNSRLDTIQAAILQIKLAAFEEYELDNVNKAANRYTEYFENIVEVPIVEENYYSSWAQYTIKLKSGTMREKIRKSLINENIPCMIYYPKLMHTQKAFYNKGRCYSGCPISVKLNDIVLSIPIHPYIEEKEIEQVAKTIKNNLDMI